MKVLSRNRLLALGAMCAIAVGLIGGATAIAQEPPPGEDAPATEGRAPGHRYPHLLVGLRGIVDASGLDFAVFRAGFQEDKSINDILTENGVDPAAVKAEVLATLEAKLDEKVASGDLNEEQAAAMLERASEHLDKLMSSAPPDRGDRPHRPRALLHGIRTAAETIGIEIQALVEALRAGDTIADVATDSGVDPQSVVDALVAEANAHIDSVAANRDLTDEQVAEWKAKAAERIEQFVLEGRPERPARETPAD